ncbi:hypothetical protein CLAFUW4_13924 [Fulvia fulva]|nr:hypothetical protein CLAFUR4_13927 [Fulvia fulva]KAK4610821.1 hypothetical protein CLAFUR0_13931 [Fulvia fulva]WPV21960.1 hypothetical protein CLAFUW4_13924 [Fulvia fulva]
MDTRNANKKYRTTPEFAEYQAENFWKSNEGEVPPFNTDPSKLEELAQRKLSEGGWYYASSNAGQALSHLANRQAFYRHKIIPRMLVDTNKRDIAWEIWGHKVAAPIGFAPVGINKIYNPAGELPVAKVAGELNLSYCLSTAGSQPIKDVGKANGNGPRFFQLHMPHDDELTISLLQRAHDSGFTACILTIQPNEAGRKSIDNVWHGRAHDWSKMPWLIKTWKETSGGKPFAIKGIQSVQDAKKCVEVGCDGVVVSNHAGRQVHGAIGSLDALDNIVNAVGDKTYIMFDSGIRGATDIVKALSLGAKFVFVGRLWIWGLSIMGEPGVRHVMKSLLADLDIMMNVAGIQSIDQLDRTWLESQPKSDSLIQERAKL